MPMQDATHAKVISTKQAAHALGIGPTTLYKLLAERRLQSIRIGRRRLVLVDSIDALILHQESGATTIRSR